MNTTTMDEIIVEAKDKPGSILASLREQKGYSTEYVAGKLHLRVRLIELLEADDYYNMPEPVFIRGYLRAYAKLLDLDAKPLMDHFNSLYVTTERKHEKALWQSRRETHKGEHAMRWFTGLFAVGVVIAVAVWWEKNKDNEHIFPESLTKEAPLAAKPESEIRLTDLSKMRSILAQPPMESINSTDNITETERD